MSSSLGTIMTKVGCRIRLLILTPVVSEIVIFLLSFLLFSLLLDDIRPTIFQARDIARARLWWDGQPILHGPEFTNGGYIPGPLYYLIISIPLLLGGNWWSVSYLCIALMALSVALLWSAMKRYWGVGGAFWVSFLYIGSECFTNHLTTDWNASFQPVFSVLCSILIFEIWGDKGDSSKRWHWILFCLVCSLGCQIHFSIIYYFLLALFLSLVFKIKKVPKINFLEIVFGIIVFLLPMTPYLIWRTFYKSWSIFRYLPAPYFGVPQPFSSFLGESGNISGVQNRFMGWEGVVVSLFQGNYFFLFSLVLLSSLILISIFFYDGGLTKKILDRVFSSAQQRYRFKIAMIGLFFLLSTGIYWASQTNFFRYIFHLLLSIDIFFGIFIACTLKYFLPKEDIRLRYGLLASWFFLAAAILGENYTGFYQQAPIWIFFISIFLFIIAFHLVHLLGIRIQTRLFVWTSVLLAFAVSQAASYHKFHNLMSEAVSSDPEVRISSFVSAGAVRWACTIIKRDTTWNDDEIFERIATIRIYLGFDMTEVCRSVNPEDITELVRPSSFTPDGYFIFREKFWMEKLHNQCIECWIRKMSLPREIRNLSFSKELEFGLPDFSHGMGLLPYKFKNPKSLIRNFHNRGKSYRFSRGDEFLENRGSEEKGHVDFGDRRHLLFWNYCNEEISDRCRVGVVLDLSGEHWTLEYIGSPLGNRAFWQNPVTVQWEDSVLVVKCKDGSDEHHPLLSRIGNVNFSYLDNYFLSPLKVHVFPRCRGQVKGIKFEIDGLRIQVGENRRWLERDFQTIQF
ncbi:MAG: hypothetical protein IPL83_02170 [Bdellovibrionales bacterium]|nr:hypothetical protein [Bdellovibrionales bacterium]